MRSGYGRGYYGEGQLAPQPPRNGSGWVKLALVVGVGAAVWYLWPRKPRFDYDNESGGGGNGAPGGDGNGPLPAAPLPPPLPFQGIAADSRVPFDQTQPLLGYPSVHQDAQSRGYPSHQAYEDAVVASARQLQDTGARVTFAPHLQHLTPRLGP